MLKAAQSRQGEELKPKQETCLLESWAAGPEGERAKVEPEKSV